MRAYEIARIAPNSKPSLRLSQQQHDALNDIAKWWRSDKQVYHLAGFAGSGKTELIVRLQHEASNLAIQYAAFTGKAASVLRQHGADNATTLHRLLYGAPTILKSKHGDHLIWRRRDQIGAGLVVADECSMIDHTLGRDLLATGRKVLVTGDQMQLPSVNGSPFFNGEPHFTLTEIHRQAANSQPLQLATAIRNGEWVRPERFDLDRLLEADVAIVALNSTRRHINKLIRKARGIVSKRPVGGDRLVCLPNNYESGVLNGTLWTIQQVVPDRDNTLILYITLVDDVGNQVEVEAHDDGFDVDDLRDPEYDGFDLFTYGYCLTCHRAQGSEWDNVVVIDETRSSGFAWMCHNNRSGLTPDEFYQRWLYTAVTRAKRKVTLMKEPE